MQPIDLLVPSALVLLVQRREAAQSEDEFNAITVQIVEELGRTKFVTMAAHQPAWVKVMEEVLQAIASRAFGYPFKFDQEEGEAVLCVRTRHIMDYLRLGPWLGVLDDMPVHSDRLLKKYLALAGAVLVDGQGIAKPFERTCDGRRCGHLVAIRLSALRAAGLDPMPALQAAPKRRRL